MMSCHTRWTPGPLAKFPPGLAILVVAPAVACLLPTYEGSALLAAETTLIRVTIPDKQPAGGGARITVFTAKNAQNEPRFGPNWYRPEPFFAVNVPQTKGGDVISFTADPQPGQSPVEAFPAPLGKLPAGKYQVQAVLDYNSVGEDDQAQPARTAGNLYSKVATWDYDPARPAPLELTLDQVVAARPFPQSPFIKPVVLESAKLRQFFGRKVLERAAVVLPAGYDQQPERRYPAMYIIPGFGDSERMALAFQKPPQASEGEVDFIRVCLSGQCKWGHHVYADSATNGPRGAMLVEELIPFIDQTFRTVAAPTARFVNGHSSGGWSSLWLQVTYPDTFGGVWSTAPDPVDFRDWQQVNLYADPPLNLYRDERGERRPIARRNGKVELWYDSFCHMDDVLGRGGQMRSFEAVFSPLGDDGLPRQMWNRQTGQVDPAVVKAWEAYDIRLKLERNWATLGPKLTGKLHIITGDVDTYYLEGAVKRLRETLEELKSDAEITVVPGADHGSVLSRETTSRIRREMSAAFRKHHDP